MNKIILDRTEYIFDASTRRITITDRAESFNLENFLVITNVTTNTIIYNFACEGLGGDLERDGKTVLILDYDTSNMNDEDSLQIIFSRPEKETENYFLQEDIANSLKLNKEILKQLIINNKYLSDITGNEYSGDDIEIQIQL